MTQQDKPLITLCYTYYGQQDMIERHRKAWDGHRYPVDYIIVDDCFPIPLYFSYPNLRTFRITTDILWNVAGARNLSIQNAKTNWLLICDFDYVITNEVLDKIHQLRLQHTEKAYLFDRIKYGQLECTCNTNVLISQMAVRFLSGYDEDFCGAYGKEDTLFWRLMQSKIRVIRTNILIDHYISEAIGLEKNTERNTAIFDPKYQQIKDGVYKNGKTLRFEWHETTKGR